MSTENTIKFVRMNSTEGFFTGIINGKRVLVPVTDEMPLDTEGMKALAGEETMVEENLKKGLTASGKPKPPRTGSYAGVADPKGTTIQFS